MEFVARKDYAACDNVLQPVYDALLRALAA